MQCSKCGSRQCVKNGLAHGKQRFKCKSCGCNFTTEVDLKRESERRHKAAELFLSGYSLREIASRLEVSHVTIMRWLKDIGDHIQQELNRMLIDREAMSVVDARDLGSHVVDELSRRDGQFILVQVDQPAWPGDKVLVLNAKWGSESHQE